MSVKIGILLGDDIGLEVVPECIKVMKAAAARERLDIEWRTLPIGKQGHEQHGNTLPAVTEQTLRELERNGLVNRIDHQEVPPRVEYELTELGNSLSDLMRKLDAWAEANIAEVLKARAAFEAQEQSSGGT